MSAIAAASLKNWLEMEFEFELLQRLWRSVELNPLKRYKTNKVAPVMAAWVTNFL